MMTPATGEIARSISEAVCIISMMAIPSELRCSATLGITCAKLVKAATPEPVNTVTKPMMAESTTPVPVTPKPQFLATSIRYVIKPTFCKPLAKKAATKIRPTVLVRMGPCL